MDPTKGKLLQELVIERLLEKLADPEACTPGMLQAALRFLADNNISESLPVPGAGIKRDAEKAPFQLKGIG